ncbi:uncharacterized protein LOC144946247 [Lampetra fluviatilis]
MVAMQPDREFPGILAPRDSVGNLAPPDLKGPPENRASLARVTKEKEERGDHPGTAAAAMAKPLKAVRASLGHRAQLDPEENQDRQDSTEKRVDQAWVSLACLASLAQTDRRVQGALPVLQALRGIPVHQETMGLKGTESVNGENRGFQDPKDLKDLQ